LRRSRKINPLATVGSLNVTIPLISRIGGIDMQAVEYILAKLGQLLGMNYQTVHHPEYK